MQRPALPTCQALSGGTGLSRVTRYPATARSPSPLASREKTVPRTGTGPWLPRLAAGNFSTRQATGGGP